MLARIELFGQLLSLKEKGETISMLNLQRPIPVEKVERMQQVKSTVQTGITTEGGTL